MSKFKGTQGKWRIGRNILDGEVKICDTYTDTIIGTKSNEESVTIDIANTKLIAAAPELLEALESITDYWESPQKGSLNDHVNQVVM